MKDPNIPKIYKRNQLPEEVMAQILLFWEKNGGIPPDISRIVITYHDGIYTDQPMSRDLYIHEMVHFVRQGNGESKELADKWVKTYLNNPVFRYEEELMAYREQYKYLKHILNKPQAFNAAKFLASELCSQKYGFENPSETNALMAIIKN